MLLGDLLDVHAALRREQQQRALGRRIVEHGRVHLVRDRHLLLDQHLGDAMLADAHAEDGGCGGPRLVRRGRQLDAAGLAALAGRHLRLDHARPELARRGGRLIGAGGQPALRRVDAGRPQHRLGSVLLEVHATTAPADFAPLPSGGAATCGHDLVAARPHDARIRMSLHGRSRKSCGRTGRGGNSVAQPKTSVIRTFGPPSPQGRATATTRRCARHRVTFRTSPSRRRTALPRSACPRGWW